MDNKLTDLARTIQQTVLNRFAPTIEQFATELEIQFKEERTIHKLDQSERQTDLWMNIYFKRPSINKTIHFAFYDGYNGNKELFYDLDILILTSGHKRNVCSIKEFYKHLGIPYSFNNFFHQQGSDHLQHQLDVFLTTVNDFLNLSEIQSILYSDAWIDIPIDMSEYK